MSPSFIDLQLRSKIGEASLNNFIVVRRLDFRTFTQIVSIYSDPE